MTFVSRTALVLLLAASAGAQAQVYRIVGPDGKVTFSDQPPVRAPGKATAINVDGGPAAVAASVASLPYDLRVVAQRFPVTLYSSANCSPCGSARSMLRARGIPFSERTVETSADAEALKRISGDTSLPFGTIGSQNLQGFSDSEWTQYLDAAGYPKQSQLPSNYQAPAPSPLVAIKRIEAPADVPRTRPAPSAPTAPAPSNPAGIQF